MFESQDGSQNRVLLHPTLVSQGVCAHITWHLLASSPILHPNPSNYKSLFKGNNRVTTSLIESVERTDLILFTLTGYVNDQYLISGNAQGDPWLLAIWHIMAHTREGLL